MAYSTRPLRTQLISLYYLLLLVLTMLFVIGMPELVGADWPGWTSTVFVAYLMSLLLAALLLAASGWLAYAARWGIVVGVLIVAGRVLWGLYDAGQRAVFLVLALSPVLLMGAAAILLLWFAWPRAAAREIAEAAAAQGWQTSRELPSGVKAPVAGAAGPAVVGAADRYRAGERGVNRAFDVTGADRRYVVDMLHPRTMQALLDARQPRTP